MSLECEHEYCYRITHRSVCDVWAVVYWCEAGMCRCRGVLQRSVCDVWAAVYWFEQEMCRYHGLLDF